MVMLIILAAIVSGTSVLLLKIADTIVQMGEFANLWPQLLLVLALTAFTADSQLQFLNQAIRMYDQLEVVPIYQTFVMLAWVSVGLLVYGEYKLYES